MPEENRRRKSQVGAFMAIGIGIGVAIGAAVDASHHK